MKIKVIDEDADEVVSTYDQGSDELPGRDNQIWVTVGGNDIAFNVNRVERDHAPNGGKSEHRVICERLDGLEKTDD